MNWELRNYKLKLIRTLTTAQEDIRDHAYDYIFTELGLLEGNLLEEAEQ